MTRGAVDRPAATGGRPAAPVIGVGRPPWWLLVLAALVTVGVTVNLLGRGWLERMDLRVSEVTSVWALRDSWAYWPIWVVTQIGGRVTILVVLAGLVGWLAVRQRTLVPLVRVVVALALLTTVVYAFKWGTGRTAPAFPGSFFHLDGASYPSGHVANAVLMWGVARWQAVEFGLPPAVQRATWVLSVLGPVATGVAMVALDFHWVTDAVVGLSVGILLLGVVHGLDAVGLSRWVRARAGRSQA
ncbi:MULTISPECIES: phosphatase PAP2 family protein [unclassified Modestobacter]|uniref:phosphatase PAP2 family protein n=1 Tax=unclassified Modestobacter TaxID=2643866 RepID=UPI0022AA5B63|nr:MULTISPECIES: phosphatase PAP2 family protein [unclassified Modestobacter]MCZ2826796.1 phosphatase PAP2 family protein [Modestobacter sp. VKM Ac-2981]MCZ2855176.1 phosphatase PAP2 family protein [Modestobacter sp. VKM Ac-2982]